MQVSFSNLLRANLIWLIRITSTITKEKLEYYQMIQELRAQTFRKEALKRASSKIPSERITIPVREGLTKLVTSKRGQSHISLLPRNSPLCTNQHHSLTDC